jgi:hypothetical protein
MGRCSESGGLGTVCFLPFRKLTVPFTQGGQALFDGTTPSKRASPMEISLDKTAHYLIHRIFRLRGNSVFSEACCLRGFPDFSRSRRESGSGFL